MGAIQRLYYAGMQQLERRLLGSRIQEWAWRTRHLFHRQWAAAYTQTIAHPHRALLADTVCTYNPKVILEVGCNVGANLYVLHQRLPGARLYGVDINRTAIDYGRRWLAAFPQIQLDVGRADRLSQFAAGSVDVTLTDATLMCIGPDKIAVVVEELLRVTRLAIVADEFVYMGPSLYLDGHWAHDYRRLFAPYPVSLTPLPPDAWNDPVWSTYGRIVEIALKYWSGMPA